MSHLFCHSCGTKLEYAHAKPNFCVKCGTPLGNNLSQASQPAVTAPTPQLEEDETNTEHVPHIANFHVETEASARNTFTIGSLAGENTAPDYIPRRGSRSLDDLIDERGG